jgi:hypothetical protein
MKYIFRDGQAIQEPDSMRWAEWFETADRHVAFTELADGSVQVSTVFLGIDHQFGKGPPVLWETMVFHELPGQRRDESPDFGDLQRRYASHEDALRGHAEIVAMIEESYRLIRAERQFE